LSLQGRDDLEIFVLLASASLIGDLSTAAVPFVFPAHNDKSNADIDDDRGKMSPVDTTNWSLLVGRRSDDRTFPVPKSNYKVVTIKWEKRRNRVFVFVWVAV
jgi:hypothetical protein